MYAIDSRHLLLLTVVWRQADLWHTLPTWPLYAIIFRLEPDRGVYTLYGSCEFWYAGYHLVHAFGDHMMVVGYGQADGTLSLLVYHLDVLNGGGVVYAGQVERSCGVLSSSSKTRQILPFCCRLIGARFDLPTRRWDDVRLCYDLPGDATFSVNDGILTCLGRNEHGPGDVRARWLASGA